MTEIIIDKSLKETLPDLRLGCIQCHVVVAPGGEKLKTLSALICDDLKAELSMATVSKKSAVKSTKEAYRSLGKDPSRYRPSAEALTRRVVGGKGLFQINNVVDLLNLVSLESGFSIGGYDADKIEGGITLGIGKENDPYNAIGRGELNVARLPLFRDAAGAFGSPTSDSVRTMVTENTSVFLMIIFDFAGDKKLHEAMDRSTDLLKVFAHASQFENKVIALAS